MIDVEKKVQEAADELAVGSIFLSKRERKILEVTVAAASGKTPKAKPAKKKAVKKKARR